MAQSLEVNIKATSDVPQAVDRAKSAIDSLDKRASSVRGASVGPQVEQTASRSTSLIDSQFSKIGKAFGNTISSVFLSFAGPLAIISGVMSFINEKLEQSRRLAEDGFNKIAEGETNLATADEKKMANFFKLKAAREKEQKEVDAGKIEMTRKFLEETEEGRRIVRERRVRSVRPGDEAAMASQDASIQKQALEAFLNSPEGKKFAPIFKGEGGKAGSAFQVEGYSNVVGVGNNPVIALAMETNDKLASIDNNISKLVEQSFDPDPTKPLNKSYPIYSPGMMSR